VAQERSGTPSEGDPPQKRGASANGCLVILAIILAFSVGCGVLIAVGSGDSNGLSGQAKLIEVCLVAQDRVRDELVAPSSAKFPGCNGATLDRVVATGTGTWRMTSHVDADNRLGGTVRADWTATIRQGSAPDLYLVTVESLVER
jgi:hypothetical protein